MRVHLLFVFLLLLGLLTPPVINVSQSSTEPAPIPESRQVKPLKPMPTAKVSHVPEVNGAAPADYKDHSEILASKIEHVTVFSDRAEIQRIGNLRTESGFKWYAFRGLPQAVDKNRVHAQLGGDGAGRIEQVLIEEVFSEAVLPPDVGDRLHRLRELYAELLDIDQTELRRNAYLKFLRSLEFQAPFTKESGANTYTGFSARVESLHQSLDILAQSIRQAEGDLQKTRHLSEQITEKISFLENQLQSARNRRTQEWKTDVYVLIHSPGQVKSTLQLTYLIPNAKWYPVYDLRTELDRHANQADIKLAIGGLVDQYTGEDWEDVTLTLSSKDLAPLHLPVLNRWLFAEYRQAAPEVKTADLLSSQEALDSSAGGDRSYAEDSTELAEGGEIGVVKGPQQGKRAFISKAKSLRARAPMAGEADSVIANHAPEPPVDGPVASIANEALQTHPTSPSRVKQDRKARDQEVREETSHLTAGQFLTLDPLESIYQNFRTSLALERASSSAKTRVFAPKRSRSYEGPTTYPDSRLPASTAAGRLIEYTSPFKVTIKSHAPAQKIALTAQPLKAKLSYFAIPKMDQRIFLRAKTQNATLSPLLAGDAQIFMNGDLVSKTNIPTIGEDGLFDVDLGIDPSVETKRVVKKASRSTGLISKDHITEVSVQIDVANHHKFPIEVELKDHMPLSSSPDIRVEMIAQTPNANTDNLGILTWRTNVPAHKVRQFSFTYKVSHPENYLVSEFN